MDRTDKVMGIVTAVTLLVIVTSVVWASVKSRGVYDRDRHQTESMERIANELTLIRIELTKEEEGGELWAGM
jgi:hypothetical protein